MPNHVHFLIKIRPQSELIEAFQNQQLKKTRRAAHLQGFRNLEGVLQNELDTLLSEYISNQFSNFLNGYAKAFNKLNTITAPNGQSIETAANNLLKYGAKENPKRKYKLSKQNKLENISETEEEMNANQA
jgi:hypothetical protein